MLLQAKGLFSQSVVFYVLGFTLTQNITRSPMLKSLALTLTLLPLTAVASPQWLLVKQDSQSTLAVLSQPQHEDPDHATSAVLLEILPQTSVKDGVRIDYFQFSLRFDCSTQNRAQLKAITAFNLQHPQPVIALDVDGPMMNEFGQANEWSIACQKTPSTVLGNEEDIQKIIQQYRAPK